MKNMSQHTEWLSMIEVSGPFLAVSVLEKVFPQGLESLETYRKNRIRSAYEEWRDAVEPFWWSSWIFFTTWRDPNNHPQPRASEKHPVPIQNVILCDFLAAVLPFRPTEISIHPRISFFIECQISSPTNTYIVEFQALTFKFRR